MPRSLQKTDVYADLPFRIALNGRGDIPVTSARQAIRQSLFNIMHTTPGQRQINPRFGANIQQFLFEPFDEVTAEKIGNTLKRAFQNWETRIVLQNINIIMRDNAQEYQIEIFYYLRELNVADRVTVQLQKL